MTWVVYDDDHPGKRCDQKTTRDYRRRPVNETAARNERKNKATRSSYVQELDE